MPQCCLAGEVCCWGLASGSYLAFVLQKCRRTEVLLNVVSETTVSEDTVLGFRVDVLVCLPFGSSVIAFIVFLQFFMGLLQKLGGWTSCA